jgi:hypothetical protein
MNMGDYRHQYYETKPVSVAVDSATVIEIGELVYVAAGKALPANSLAWDTNLATTQESFHDAFLGVALERTRAGETDPISVGTEGVYKYPCASAAYALGALVGPAGIGTTSLNANSLASVATPNLAVGRVHEAVPSGSTSILVRIESTLLTGGPRAAA